MSFRCWFFLLCLPLSSCVYRGHYTTAGSFERTRLSLADARIGLLDPRGPFGDEFARERLHTLVSRKLGKCRPSVRLFTETELAARGDLPSIYATGITDVELTYLREQGTLDYLIYTDIGPGRGDYTTEALTPFPADREASAFLLVFDIAAGKLIKTIQVNGRLNERDELQWYEFEYDEQEIARRALKKAAKSLIDFSDCGS